MHGCGAVKKMQHKLDFFNAYNRVILLHLFEKCFSPLIKSPLGDIMLCILTV